MQHDSVGTGTEWRLGIQPGVPREGRVDTTRGHFIAGVSGWLGYAGSCLLVIWACVFFNISVALRGLVSNCLLL